jgi:hypothetical protein
MTLSTCRVTRPLARMITMLWIGKDAGRKCKYYPRVCWRVWRKPRNRQLVLWPRCETTTSGTRFRPLH